MNQTNYIGFLPFFLLQREKEGWVGEWAISRVSCLSSGENSVKALSIWIIYVKCSNESLRLRKIMDFFCTLPLKKHSANGIWCMKLLLSYSMQLLCLLISLNTFIHASHFWNPPKDYCLSPLWFFGFAVWLWTSVCSMFFLWGSVFFRRKIDFSCPITVSLKSVFISLLFVWSSPGGECGHLLCGFVVWVCMWK